MVKYLAIILAVFVCSSLMWGFLGIILVNYIDPFINSLLINLNYYAVNIIALIYILIILYQFYNQQFQVTKKQPK